jgi:hypothetical protein
MGAKNSVTRWKRDLSEKEEFGGSHSFVAARLLELPTSRGKSPLQVQVNAFYRPYE